MRVGAASGETRLMTACQHDCRAPSLANQILVSPTRRNTNMPNDLDPPRALSILARQIFDRHAARIHGEGRWRQIDVDQLATYCETAELYLSCKSAVDEHGVLVQGRTERELVRNPSLTPLNQARAALVDLARAVPLLCFWNVCDVDSIPMPHPCARTNMREFCCGTVDLVHFSEVN
jgi:phage terminase small subunit